jgi:DNA-binding transcriptional regulator YiaG
MPNAYSALKSEIVRIARREVRAETLALKQTNAQHRAAISALKAQVAALEKALRQTNKSATKALTAAAAASPEKGEPVQRRFSPSRLAAHRARLGLSAASYGRLVGMSGAAVFLWEKGEARPTPATIDALAKLKALSRKQIEERLVGS